MSNPAWACALCHLAPPDVARSKRKRDLCDLCEPGLAARGLAWCARGHRVAIDDMTARGCICRACDNKQRNAAYHRNPERGRALQRGCPKFLMYGSIGDATAAACVLNMQDSALRQERMRLE